MRKVLDLLSALFLIFLVACDEEAGEEGANEVIEEEQQDETEDDKDDLDEEATDAEVDEMESDTNREEEDHTSVNDKNDQSIANEGEDESIQQLGERIIQAQMDEDYNFLNSIIADGVVIDEANNTIEFDTEEASHTFDFVTGIKNEDLEFRFVDG